MTAAKTALLLVGSPNGLARSTASRRAALLLDALQDRRFAAAMGWEWAGGIAMGGTGISTASLQKVVALAAEALARGDPVPEEAMALAAKPAMWAWLCILGGNLMWHREARRNGVTVSLRARPYNPKKG